MTLAENGNNSNTKKKVPVTLLCGFLGAGKTTLLEHILRTKHGDGDSFKCAVIVNDMAELNIDEEAITSATATAAGSTLENEKVISMENGCICCDLQSDLAHQIIQFATKKADSEANLYDYILIEASGVSEPSEIARLFVEEEEQQHDHASLQDVARLDTCVTVVDCHDFLQQLDQATKTSKHGGATSQLLVEQIEYSNVILLNKTDLVNAAQLEQVQQRVAVLNPHAKILPTSRSNPLPNVMDVVDTKLFAPDAMAFLNKDSFANMANDNDNNNTKDCCKAQTAANQAPCCPSSRTDTGRSIVTLGTSSSNSAASSPSRHAKRFGITSFLYQSRFPFHPERFDTEFLQKYFVLSDDDDDDDEAVILEMMGDEEEKKSDGTATTEPDSKKRKITGEDSNEEKEERIMEQQVEAEAKKNLRQGAFGMLLRSKGFLWLPQMHDLKNIYSQAGSMVTVESSHIWTVLQAEAWDSNDAEKQKVLQKNWEGKYGDRRQELVFIGIDLKPNKLQALLDSCLLTPEEFAIGIDGWKAKFGDTFLD